MDQPKLNITKAELEMLNSLFYDAEAFEKKIRRQHRARIAFVASATVVAGAVAYVKFNNVNINIPSLKIPR